jgi:hypothetical protein
MGGFANKFLNFSNGRKGKIISWCVVGFSITIFLAGLLMAIIPAITNTTIKSVALTAQNMKYKSQIVYTYSSEDKTPSTRTELANAYYLTMTRDTWSISTATNTKGNITFSSNSPYIEFEKATIPANGAAILKLKRSNGEYGFSNPDPEVRLDDIVIKVSSNKIYLATIYVRIVLNARDYDFDAILESNATGEWRATDNIELKYFEPPYLNNVRYRMSFKLRIWNNVVYDGDYTAVPGLVINNNDYTPFTYRELYFLENNGDEPEYPNGADEIFYLFTAQNKFVDINPYIRGSFNLFPPELNIFYEFSCEFENNIYYTKQNFSYKIIR